MRVGVYKMRSNAAPRILYSYTSVCSATSTHFMRTHKMNKNLSFNFSVSSPDTGFPTLCVLFIYLFFLALDIPYVRRSERFLSLILVFFSFSLSGLLFFFPIFSPSVVRLELEFRVWY